MSKIQIRWNDNTGTTKVTFSKSWKELSDMSRLDSLQDAIFDLEEKYNFELDNLWDKSEKRRAEKQAAYNVVISAKHKLTKAKSRVKGKKR